MLKMKKQIKKVYNATPKSRKNFINKIFSNGFWACVGGLSWEFVEETLESFIAELLTNLIAVIFIKALLTIAVIGSTIAIKRLLKSLLRPLIKTITYREGNDKVKALQNYWTKIRGNKITGTMAGLGFAGISFFQTLIPFATNNWWVALIVFVVFFNIGIFFGGETLKQIQERLQDALLEKEHKKVVKEAQKRYIESKRKESQTETEKAKLEAKEKADKEFNDKVEIEIKKLQEKEKQNA